MRRKLLKAPLLVALLALPAHASAEAFDDLYLLVNRLGGESRDAVHAACAGSIGGGLGRISLGGLPRVLQSLPARHPLAGLGAALLAQMERTASKRSEVQAQCSVAVEGWRLARDHPATSAAARAESLQQDAFRCAALAENLRSDVLEEAELCVRLLRDTARAAAGLEGPMPVGLSPYQSRSEIEPLSSSCDEDSCFLDVEAFTRGDYGWLGKKPAEILVNFRADDAEAVEGVLALVIMDDCQAALRQVQVWRERLTRLVGPSASHFHDGEGFATACGAGKGKIWLDDYALVLQAVEVDGVPYATFFVERTNRAGRDESPAGAGAL